MPWTHELSCCPATTRIGCLGLVTGIMDGQGRVIKHHGPDFNQLYTEDNRSFVHGG